jgi:hypothetical protein
MPPTHERSRLPWYVGALTITTFAVCAWIAATVSLGAAAVGVIGVISALWLYVTSTGGPGPGRLQPIRVRVRTKP